jgi:hypothetical protein
LQYDLEETAETGQDFTLPWCYESIQLAAYKIPSSQTSFSVSSNASLQPLPEAGARNERTL